jgi:hypothetical protein
MKRALDNNDINEVPRPSRPPHGLPHADRCATGAQVRRRHDQRAADVIAQVKPEAHRVALAEGPRACWC